MTPAEIAYLLKAAARTPALVNATAWANRQSSAGRSGEGQRSTGVSITEFGEELREYAQAEISKGAGRCYSLGLSAAGGSLDEECESVHGLLLDSDGLGDFVPLKKALDAAGLGYVIQRRGEKFHAHVFLADPMFPTKALKTVYRALVEHTLVKLGEVAGVTFDRAPASRFLGLCYAYTKRPEAPYTLVETVYREGAALDLAAFVMATGFVEPVAPFTAADAARPAAPAAVPAPGDFFAAMKARAAPPEVPAMTPEETRAAIARGIARNRRPDRHAVLQAFAAGRAFAEHGERNQMAQRLCSWLAWFTEGRGDPETIFDMFSGSLVAMAPTKLDQAVLLDGTATSPGMIGRALDDAARKIGEQKVRDARIAAAFTGRRATT